MSQKSSAPTAKPPAEKLVRDIRRVTRKHHSAEDKIRIVAKVDALMALCDRLEASLDLTAATRRRLLDALLAEALEPAEATAA
jgi:type I restriction enzyme S subunit